MGGFTTTPVDSEARGITRLTMDFVAPPSSSRPGAYWCWLNGDMTKESITYDLEEMQDKGIGRAEIWDVALRDDPEGKIGRASCRERV